MRILHLVFANKSTGYGHFFRSLTLAQSAKERGHTVYFASDRKPGHNLIHIPMEYPPSLPALDRMLIATKPDWLIIDLPHDIPGWIRAIASCRICTLNGIGYDQNDDVDLRIIQGVDGLELPKPEKGKTVKGVEYVIIRPELERYKGVKPGEDTFVWGGAADNVGLLSRFPNVCPGWFATLIMVDETPVPPVVSPTQVKVKVNPETTEIFDWMAGSPRAVVSMGMIIYELAYLSIPTWVFNYSDLHLRFARGAQSVGLVKAFGGVGLPDDKTMRGFLDEPFEPWGEPPTTEGAANVLRLLEDG